jgi:hypothetical protein
MDGFYASPSSLKRSLFSVTAHFELFQHARRYRFPTVHPLARKSRLRFSFFLPGASLTEVTPVFHRKPLFLHAADDPSSPVLTDTPLQVH